MLFAWSADHNDWYFNTYDVNHRPICIFRNRMNVYQQDIDTGTKRSVEWKWDPSRHDLYFTTHYLNGLPFYIYRKHLLEEYDEYPQNTGAVQQAPANLSTHSSWPQAQAYGSPAYQSPQIYQVPSVQPTTFPLTQQAQHYGQQAGKSPSYSPPQTSPPILQEARLDPSYRVRTKKEAHAFFKEGKVFAMLHCEIASATSAPPTGRSVSSYTPGRFGETVYSDIRRFVIVRVRRKKHLVQACPISTYQGRGTLKRGCFPEEHTIVYLTGTEPKYFEGEKEKGLTNEPLEITPTDWSEKLDPASRLRLGKIYSIEWNVKARDVGQIIPGHMARLLKYFEDANRLSDNEG